MAILGAIATGLSATLSDPNFYTGLIQTFANPDYEQNLQAAGGQLSATVQQAQQQTAVLLAQRQAEAEQAAAEAEQEQRRQLVQTVGLVVVGVAVVGGGVYLAVRSRKGGRN